MATAEPNLTYFMRRAREEAHSALRADKPEVAAVHHDLSVRYSARALMAMREDDPSTLPQLRPHTARPRRAGRSLAGGQ